MDNIDFIKSVLDKQYNKLELVELSLRSILENQEIKTEQIKKALSELLKEIR